MPRQQINLEPYRDEIITLFQHGISSDSISRTLESRYNIQVKERTIQSRLRKWGIRKRSRTTTADEVLHARIKVLFMQDRLTDKAMLKLLRQDGYDISERTLRRLRFQLGLHARASTFEQERGVGSCPLPLPIAMSVPVHAAKDGPGPWPATLPEPIREVFFPMRQLPRTPSTGLRTAVDLRRSHDETHIFNMLPHPRHHITPYPLQQTARDTHRDLIIPETMRLENGLYRTLRRLHYAESDNSTKRHWTPLDI